MCYDVTSGLKALIKYAKHRHDDPAYIAKLEKELEEWLKEGSSHHHISGYEHPKLLVFTNDKPLHPQAFIWGLIPSWVKDAHTAKTIYNQTLNARVETIFDKPSFRNAAKNKRCLIYLDAFYEYHHQKKKSYPFQISAKNDSPLAVAGLWDEWTDRETGEVIKTVSIVTTKAGALMGKIHNNPKLPEPRMPAILPRELQNQWLEPFETEADKQNLLQLCVSFPDELLKYHTVRPLKGKNAVGDTPEAEQQFDYPELEKF